MYINGYTPNTNYKAVEQIRRTEQVQPNPVENQLVENKKETINKKKLAKYAAGAAGLLLVGLGIYKHKQIGSMLKNIGTKVEEKEKVIIPEDYPEWEPKRKPKLNITIDEKGNILSIGNQSKNKNSQPHVNTQTGGIFDSVFGGRKAYNPTQEAPNYNSHSRNASDYVTDAIDTATDVIIIDEIMSNGKSIFSHIKDSFGTNTVSEAAENIGHDISGVTDTIAESSTGILDSIADGIGSFTEGLGDALGDIFDGIA